MFGTNAIRKREAHTGETLQVREVFYTIQGEGPFMGSPAVFVRLTGCNVACWFCDTKWDDTRDPEETVDQIVQHVLAAAAGSGAPHDERRTSLVVLTGGEPTRQPLTPLLTKLGELGFRVQIETNGTLWDPALALPHVVVVVSPKTPKIHPQVWNLAQAFKYVIRTGETDMADGLPNASTQHQNDQRETMLARPRPGAEVFVSPCDEYDEAKNRANTTLVGAIALRYGYRVSLQQHKYLNLP